MSVCVQCVRMSVCSVICVYVRMCLCVGVYVCVLVLHVCVCLFYQLFHVVCCGKVV